MCVVHICSADYVELPVLLYLLQCLVLRSISHAVQNEKNSGIYIYTVIGEVLVLDLLVVMYMIPHRSCM